MSGTDEVIRSRLQARNWNADHVTELDEPLRGLPVALPSSDGKDPLEIPPNIPVDGRQIHAMGRKPCRS